MRRHITILIALVVLVAGTVAAVVALRGSRSERLAPLFDGPEEYAPASPEGVVPVVQYNKTPWLGKYRPPEGSDPSHLESLRPGEKSDRLEYVDGAGRDQLEEHMRQRPPVDAKTGATRVVRLQSPTVYEEKWLPRFLTVAKPIEGAVFPPNLCPPFVEWSDAQNDLWQVTIEIPSTRLFWRGITDQPRWRIPDDVWGVLVQEAVDRDATVTVRGVKTDGTGRRQRDTVHVSQTVRFRVSRDEADPAIVYRLVTPPFARYKTPNMYVREIGRKEDRPFLKARRTYCFNCHTFSRKTPGGKMALQVRYMGMEKHEHPVYFIVHDFDRKKTTRTALPFKLQMTTFMAWSPDEEKLAFSANQALVTLPPTTLETQFAAQPSSDIAVYDVKRDTAYLLPGASDPRYLEVYPRWTPKGDAIIYCRAPAGVHPALTKFQLWRVPFNGGDGGKGEPLPHVHDEEAKTGEPKSSYYPRFSPNGKWFTFTRSDGGSLIKSSSDIWIMPADFSEAPRKLQSNVEHAADSWYSWSSNGRWIVFASKRDDGVFARLYLTHIDEHGNASPPVALPLSDPPMMSFNIPEFVARVPDVTERKLYDGVRVENQAVMVGKGSTHDAE